MKIFAINPGSTGMKSALYDDLNLIWSESESYRPEDIDSYKGSIEKEESFRLASVLNTLKKYGSDPGTFSAVVGRGGLLRPLAGGAWLITEAMIDDLRSAKYGKHASNFGGLLAKRISDKGGSVPAFIIDPVCVDEMSEVARVSGIPGIPRRSIFHALNQKAVARRVSRQIGKPLGECSLIVAHMGGGITVGAHLSGRVVDVNNGLGGYGPFSLDRAGTVHAGDLIKKCFSGKYTREEAERMIIGGAGIAAHLGTNDFKVIVERVLRGDERAALLVEALAYQIAAEIGSRAVNLCGKIDAIILTGGLANSPYLCELIKKRVSWISEVITVPGEDELGALAEGAYRIISGEEEAHIYG